MINEIVRRMFRSWAAKPPAPKSYDANDPRAPWNLGWTRVDVPDSCHRVRFRFTLGDPPRAVPPAPPITGAGFISGGGGHVDHHADAPKQVARPVPPRTGIPQAPRSDSFYGKVRG